MFWCSNHIDCAFLPILVFAFWGNLHSGSLIDSTTVRRTDWWLPWSCRNEIISENGSCKSSQTCTHLGRSFEPSRLCLHVAIPATFSGWVRAWNSLDSILWETFLPTQQIRYTQETKLLMYMLLEKIISISIDLLFVSSLKAKYLFLECLQILIDGRRACLNGKL